MESDHVPEITALKQLELLVYNLGDELATFRKRAQVAEQRLRALEDIAAQRVGPVNAASLRALEDENADLRARLTFATERTNQLLARVRFLRQQNGRTSGSHPAVTGGER